MGGDGESKLTGMDAQVAMAQLRQGFRGMKNMPFLGSMSGLSRIGSTNFEERELNAMLDMVDNAKPSDLTATGRDLEQAAKDIKRIGDDIKKHVGEVVWEGEGGSSFHKWGGKLGTSTLKLAEYTFTAASQLKSAGEGLAEVKAAMPPRDSRILQKAPEDIPSAKRVETNDEYTAAVKTEKHRQEAITQMNKLSSYYQVTHDTIAMQPEPVFEPMDNPGVPRPVNQAVGGPGGGLGNEGNAMSGGTPSLVGDTRGSAASSLQAGDPFAGGQELPSEPSALRREGAVGTSVDSATPLAPQAPVGGEVLQQTSNSPVGGTASPQFVGAPVQPMRGQVASGMNPGRPLASGPGSSRGGTPIARNPSDTARPAQPGRAAPAAGSGKTDPGGIGRPSGHGTSSSRPGPVSQRAVGRPAPTQGRGVAMPARSARGDGVVGGKPNHGADGRAMASGPRGAVAGGERGIGAGRGVVGSGMASRGTPKGQATAARNSDGVSARPKLTRSSTGRKEFTPGGTGLLGKAAPGSGLAAGAGQKSDRRKREDRAIQRPDFLVEDRETWTQGRHPATPPVIE